MKNSGMMVNKQAIDDFINDFKLRHPEGVIGFAARVRFHKNGLIKIRYTEVQILKGNDLNTVYLINPDLPFEDLPDTFMLHEHHFEYIPQDRLEIVSKENSKCFVEIMPVVVE